MEKLNKPFSNNKNALNWLNTCIEPYKLYLDYIKENGADETILLPDHFGSWSDDQFREFAYTTAGQKFKREILMKLFPDETPQPSKQTWISDKLKKEFEGLGYRVVELPMSEFRKNRRHHQMLHVKITCPY